MIHRFSPNAPTEQKKAVAEAAAAEVKVDPAATAPSEVAFDKLILFTTKTCPNCRMAKTFLDRAGLLYDTVIANEEPDLSRKYGVRQAPTLVAVSGENVEKIVNVSNIRKFIDELVKPSETVLFN
jgi:ribonucleoside-triphosphate reductase